ncbi:MAG: hypothetical protein JWO31_2969, partial [Phycisphaerales bacterium]|nr:hypothetical protein [Phycisphaerales bacterium]
MAADIDALFAPAYAAFPLSVAALDAAKQDVLRRYPPVPAVTRLVVVDPTTGAAVGPPLADGAVLGGANAAAALPPGATIAAEVSGQPCTLVFEFDGVVVKQETTPPYSVGGDGAGGRLNPWAGLTPGPHRLRVTPYHAPGGRVGNAVDVSFTVAVPSPTVPPLPPPASSGGWTAFPLADGARQVFVRADGDDGNAGDTPARPVRSLARAMALVRPAGGDRVMLYAGHTFAGRIGNWRASGLPGRPAGVFAYGDDA